VAGGAVASEAQLRFGKNSLGESTKAWQKELRRTPFQELAEQRDDSAIIAIAAISCILKQGDWNTAGLVEMTSQSSSGTASHRDLEAAKSWRI